MNPLEPGTYLAIVMGTFPSPLSRAKRERFIPATRYSRELAHLSTNFSELLPVTLSMAAIAACDAESISDSEPLM